MHTNWLSDIVEKTNPRKWLSLIALLVASTYGISFLAPVVGGFLDDGIYVATAKSIAEGNGYRISGLSPPIVQTKYPFLFPLALAGIWRIFGGFPQNVLALKSIPLLFGLLWGWTIHGVFRDRLGNTGAAFLALLTMALPWVVFISSSLLTESIFASLTWLALLWMSRAGRTASHRQVIAIAAVAGAAFLARSSGIAFAVAGLAVLCTWRRWRSAFLFAAVFALLCSPWIVWQAAHPAPADPVLAYYSKANYAQWNLLANFDVNQKWSILWRNLLRAAYTPAAFMGFPARPIAGLVTLPLVVMAVFGWWSTYKQDFGIIPIWSAVYFVLVMSWAWPSERFLVVLAPLMFYYIWIGMCLAMPQASRKPLAGVCLAISFTICGIGLYGQARDTLRGGLACLPGMGLEDWRGFTLMLKEFGARATTETVLAGNLDPMYSLYSGVNSIRPYSEDPYLLYFSEEPGRKPLGDLAQFIYTLRSHRVSHLVVDRLKLFQESKYLNLLVDELRNAHPGSLTLQAQTADGHFRIYSIDWSLLTSSTKRR